jgi:hypothetical protein
MRTICGGVVVPMLALCLGCAQVGRPVSPHGRRLCCGSSPTSLTVESETGIREETVCAAKVLATPSLTVLLAAGVTIWTVAIAPIAAVAGRLISGY